MLSQVVFMIEEDPEGGYTARALGHSIYTEADTWDDLKEAVQDAARCHFDESKRPIIARSHRKDAKSAKVLQDLAVFAPWRFQNLRTPRK